MAGPRTRSLSYGAEPWADLNLLDTVFNILDKGDKYFKRGVGND